STTVGMASRTTAQAGLVTFTRNGDTSTNLVVKYALDGTAVGGIDYSVSPAGPSVTIPAGASSATLSIVPRASTNVVAGSSLSLRVATATNYTVGSPATATLSVSGNTVPASLRVLPNGATLSWASTPNRVYEVACKDHLTDPSWTNLGQMTATSNSSTWTD